MKTTLTKSKKLSIILTVLVLLTIFFFALTLGLALRPYSTIMPYMTKLDDGTMLKCYTQDDSLVVKSKGNDDCIIKYNPREADPELLNAFTLKIKQQSINGTFYKSIEFRNVGNFVCVFLFAFFTLLCLCGSIYVGVTMNKKE